MASNGLTITLDWKLTVNQRLFVNLLVSLLVVELKVSILGLHSIEMPRK
jgi:hypothetical protein